MNSIEFYLTVGNHCFRSCPWMMASSLSEARNAAISLAWAYGLRVCVNWYHESETHQRTEGSFDVDASGNVYECEDD